jgi:hypothetical protein
LLLVPPEFPPPEVLEHAVSVPAVSRRAVAATTTLLVAIFIE